MQKALARYPDLRLRRLRQSGWVRELVQETRLHTSDFIWPVFIIEGKKKKEAISSLPGVSRLSIDLAVAEIKKASDLGIQAVALFPVIDAAKKNREGSESYNADNLICRAIQAIKKSCPDIGIITDIALDPYTSHGHDGIFDGARVLNDETIDVLCKQALVQVKAGADIIAPSDMMDGRVGALRQMLETKKFHDTIILSYAAKFASYFYGPFRDAVQTGKLLKGDKKTYQMNPGNASEALREVALDIAEGADMVMVKPGLPYLDIIKAVKDEFKIPTFAYHVSGEYAMLRAAADKKYIDYDQSLLETMIAFKRAGATGILTYAAIDAVKLLK